MKSLCYISTALLCSTLSFNVLAQYKDITPPVCASLYQIDDLNFDSTIQHNQNVSDKFNQVVARFTNKTGQTAVFTYVNNFPTETTQETLRKARQYIAEANYIVNNNSFSKTCFYKDVEGNETLKGNVNLLFSANEKPSELLFSTTLR